MSLTFPRVMPSVGILSQSFEIQRNDFLTPERSGRVYAVAGAWPLWTTEFQLQNMTVENFDTWLAWIMAQRGPLRQFYGFEVTKQIPRAHQDGRPYAHTAASWSLNTDRDVLTLNGLLSGQVVSVADHIGFVWDTTKRALVRALESAAADASGTLTVTVEPAVPTLVPGTAVATLHEPNCLMRLLPDTSVAPRAAVGYAPAGTKVVAVQDLVP